eukprot:2395542-Prymnesium_polylepis.1
MAGSDDCGYRRRAPIQGRDGSAPTVPIATQVDTGLHSLDTTSAVRARPSRRPSTSARCASRDRREPLPNPSRGRL